MTPQNEAIFAPLKASMATEEMTLAGMLQGIAELIGANTHHAYSFTMHLRDVAREGGDADGGDDGSDGRTYIDLTVEAWRRAYFDHDTVAMYGEEPGLVDDPVKLTEFVQFITARLHADRTAPEHTAAVVHAEHARMQ